MSELKFDEIIDSFNDKAKEAVALAGMIVLRKAKELCPVQTGTLRRSIATQPDEVDGEPVCIVFTNVEYAPFVEAGTKFSNAKPFLQPAVEQSRDAILECFKNLTEG